MNRTDLFDPAHWKYESSVKEGFHEVVTPDNSICKVTWAFRLNLQKGKTYSLLDNRLELNGVVISGKMKVKYDEDFVSLNKYDSFYLPADKKLIIKATEDMSLFIGGAQYDEEGSFFIRK